MEAFYVVGFMRIACSHSVHKKHKLAVLPYKLWPARFRESRLQA